MNECFLLVGPSVQVQPDWSVLMLLLGHTGTPTVAPAILVPCRASFSVPFMDGDIGE